MEKLKIIALMGRSEAGKNTAGEMLCDMGQGAQMAFADKLKKIAGEMFSLSDEDMNTEKGKAAPTTLPCLLCPTCHTPEVEEFTQEYTKLARCKVCGVIGDSKVFNGFWTPRTILQFLGTECFRKISPSVWSDYAISSARKILTSGAAPKGPVPFVVLTDLRFKSEAEAVWAVGGQVWRIRRPETDELATGLKGHASENEQDSIPDSKCQAVIMNDGTLDSLRGRLVGEFNKWKDSQKS
jgi:hypothetical protein